MRYTVGDGSGSDVSVPSVAVIIPAWRATATIERAVASALAQTIPCQVIVVDDCSPDDTADVARAADDGRGLLTVLRQGRNQGPAAARNRGIAVSEAPWIALLDADDVMEPGRIAGLLAIAGSNDTPDWDFVADDLWRVTEGALDGPRTRLISEEAFDPYRLDFENFVLGNIHGSRGARGELGFLKPMMRRAFLQENAITYDETMRLGEDYDLYARALACGARFRVTEPMGYLAVAQEGSLSARHGAVDLGGIVAADRALLANAGLSGKDQQAVRQHLAQVHREWAWMRLIDAVKARAPLDALGCFTGPPGTAFSLFWRLGEQVFIRTRRRFLGEPGA